MAEQQQRRSQLLSLDELNRIVLEFLHKKGYSHTAAMLRLESSRAVTPQADNGSATGVASGQLPTSSATGPEFYAKTYLVLKEWIESSLDLYQPELSRVLYPLFVFMYLELLTLNEPEKARDFFDTFVDDHSLLHAGDLRVLQGLKLGSHVEENELAQRFLSKRSPIVLSRTAFDLLLHFLLSIDSQGGYTVIRLFNQHFKLTVTDSISQMAEQPAEADESSNNAPLRLGRMPLDPEFKQEVQQMIDYKDKNEAQPDGRPLGRIFNDITAPEQDSPAVESLPRPRFRPVDVDAEIAKVIDYKERIHLTAPGEGGALPSVCMYTFHNTYDELNTLAFSNDSSMCAGGFADSYVQLWSLKDKEKGSRRFIGHSGAVYGLSFSPDNRTLLSSSEDNTVRLWSLDTNTAIVAYHGHTEPVWDVAYGPFGHYFATASHDQTARLWSCDHVYPLRIFAGHLSDVDCVCFHPNGTYVFTGSSDKTVRMWEIAKGTCVRVFIGHIGAVTALAVSPDGRWLATAGEDSIINLWDIGSGRRLKAMRGHGRTSIYSLSFSMSGEILVSGAADNTVRVWDVKRNTAEANPAGEPEPVKLLQSMSSQPQGKGRRKEVVVTTDHLAVLNTKRTPVYKVQFTPRNLVIAGGAFLG